MRSQYELALRARGVSIDAGLNDAPLLRVGGGRSATMRAAADLWLTPEGNTLTASVSALDECDDAPLVDLLIAQPDNKLPPLARVAWSLPLAQPFEPFRIELPVALRRPVQTRLWRDVSDPVELDEAAQEAALDAALHLVDALSRRDVEAVIELVRYRTDETARAFEFDPSENERAVRRSYEDLMSDPAFAVIPAPRRALRVTSCAGDRVFHVARDDGRDLVLTRGGAEHRMQVYVAPVDGAWRVVR